MTSTRLMRPVRKQPMRKEKMCLLTSTVLNTLLVCPQIAGSAFAGLPNTTSGQSKDVDLYAINLSTILYFINRIIKKYHIFSLLLLSLFKRYQPTSFYYKYKYISMDQYPIFRTNQVDFLSPSFLPKQQNRNENLLLSDNAIAREVFMKSINKSYLGRMSNQKEIANMKTIEEEDFIENKRAEITPIKKQRINFSSFKGHAKEQIRQTFVSEEDLKYLYIKSFVNREGTEMFSPTNGCIFACQSNLKEPNKCLVEMINQSTLELFRSNQQGIFSQLFCSVNFDTVSAEIQFKKIQQNNELMIYFGGYTLLLSHNKYKVLEHWHNAIEKMLEESKGKQFKLNKILKEQQFYKSRYETQDFFVKNCQTGDMILFQDDHFFAKVQRFVTRSDFDHVAMVVKSPQHGLLLFQSNGGTGVSLTPWRYVIRYGWYNNIPKISWRRLKTDRNEEFNSIVAKFVTENLQKDYHISIGKLTAHQSIVRTPGVTKQKTEDDSDDSGFFCSELVATLYKQLGLLTRNKESQSYQPACKFYPKDFSQKSGRNLDKGKLSAEYEIYFDNILLKQTYKGIIKQQKK